MTSPSCVATNLSAMAWRAASCRLSSLTIWSMSFASENSEQKRNKIVKAELTPQGMRSYLEGGGAVARY